jgi:hypothetical protein
MIRDMIEKLTEILSCAGASSPKTLWRLRHWFWDLRQWAGRKSQPEIMLLAQAASQFLEKMILDRAVSRPEEQRPLGPEDIRSRLLESIRELPEDHRGIIRMDMRRTIIKTNRIV